MVGSERTTLRALFFDVKSLGSFGAAVIAAGFGVYSLFIAEPGVALVMFGLAAALCMLGIVGIVLKRRAEGQK